MCLSDVSIEMFLPFVAKNWPGTGQQSEHHMVCVAMPQYGSEFEIEESHSTHWAMAIELIGSRGACCVANFVYNVVSLVSPL